MSYQHPRRGCIDIIFVTLTIFNPDLYYGTMIIDAHIHIWHRDMIPDRAIEIYLEPLKKLKGMYGGVFDFGLDDIDYFVLLNGYSSSLRKREKNTLSDEKTALQTISMDL